MPNKNILLIEPRYKNKFPPLGLMKIAQYHGPEGKRVNVHFAKGEDARVLEMGWDRVYVTSLFSFEWRKTADAVDFAMCCLWLCVRQRNGNHFEILFHHFILSF